MAPQTVVRHNGRSDPETRGDSARTVFLPAELVDQKGHKLDARVNLSTDGGDPTAAVKVVIKATPPARMQPSTRTAIGCYLIALGAVLLTALLWVWSFAMSAVQGGTPRPRLFGEWQFTPTADFSILLLVLLASMLGSVVVLGMVFSARAGRRTLEQSYVWWYLMRPVTAAGLGVGFYLTVTAGFFDSITESNGRSALITAAAIGTLAGLFTDQVYAKMLKLLGLFTPKKPASEVTDTDV